MSEKWYTPAGKSYNFHMDLLQQKHLMIAGATGSGKSVVVNGVMYNALYSAPVDAANGKQFILIDPKRVELCIYKGLPHTLRYASEPDEIISALQYTLALTETRYKSMQKKGLRLYDVGCGQILGLNDHTHTLSVFHWTHSAQRYLYPLFAVPYHVFFNLADKFIY